jgi:threonyl-tRNA synthetase
MTSVYKCGNFIDLCTGPHLPSIDRMKGYKIMKNSSSYFLGNKDNDNLQRIYGISFPKQSELESYLKTQE